MEDTKGPYIMWLDYGMEGWKPESFNSIKEALLASRYQSNFVITKVCEYEVKEK